MPSPQQQEGGSPPVSVWVKSGKEEHHAFLLQQKGGKKLIQWATNQQTEWVPSSCVRHDKGGRSRRSRTPSAKATEAGLTIGTVAQAQGRGGRGARGSPTSAGSPASPGKVPRFVVSKPESNVKRQGRRGGRGSPASTGSPASAATPAVSQPEEAKKEEEASPVQAEATTPLRGDPVPEPEPSSPSAPANNKAKSGSSAAVEEKANEKGEEELPSADAESNIKEAGKNEAKEADPQPDTTITDLAFTDEKVAGSPQQSLGMTREGAAEDVPMNNQTECAESQPKEDHLEESATAGTSKNIQRSDEWGNLTPEEIQLVQDFRARKRRQASSEDEGPTRKRQKTTLSTIVTPATMATAAPTSAAAAAVPTTAATATDADADSIETPKTNSPTGVSNPSTAFPPPVTPKSNNTPEEKCVVMYSMTTTTNINPVMASKHPLPTTYTDPTTGTAIPAAAAAAVSMETTPMANNLHHPTNGHDNDNGCASPPNGLPNVSPNSISPFATAMKDPLLESSDDELEITHHTKTDNPIQNWMRRVQGLGSFQKLNGNDETTTPRRSTRNGKASQSNPEDDPQKISLVPRHRKNQKLNNGNYDKTHRKSLQQEISIQSKPDEDQPQKKKSTPRRKSKKCTTPVPKQRKNDVVLPMSTMKQIYNGQQEEASHFVTSLLSPRPMQGNEELVQKEAYVKKLLPCSHFYTTTI